MMQDQEAATDAFSDAFQAELNQLMRLRRDVRHFRRTPVDPALFDQCLKAFSLAPSVGLSEPWRIVRVQSERTRQKAIDNFEQANAQALAGYSGEDAKIYAGLKLSGMRDAPIQLAVFCDDETEKGKGLGAGTMPEMRRYSVVCAIMQFWLALRAQGLGLGWVSILDPDHLTRDLDVPTSWQLVGYLCIGWPQETSDEPELQKKGWEARTPCPPLIER